MAKLSLSENSIQVRRLGLKEYSEVWKLQKELQQALIHKTGGDVLILCEHLPAITLGKSARRENLLAAQKDLEDQGVELFEIERGGDITYHGPGQLIAYPILDLHKRKTDVGWYMRTLEEAVIRTLNGCGIKGLRVPGRTGVWINETTKIASLGVRISRWCTMHGLALNVKDCSRGFALINPCGFKNIQVSWMEKECGRSLNMDEVQNLLETSLLELLAPHGSSAGN